MEFRRVEDIETWQQRNKDLAFILCDQRQLYFPAPFHTGILTLMWLRRSVVDSSKAHRSTLLSQKSHKNNRSNEICVFKSAILTRLELSLGKENNQGGCDNIRVLSGDVYHVGHLHHPRQGEEIETFKQRHNLDSHGFEKATTMFQATHGIETEKGAWFQWLQILEESLISRWDLPRVCEKQRAESVISHESFQGKGFICSYMATQYGEIGIIDDEERQDPSSLKDGCMYVSVGKFQN